MIKGRHHPVIVIYWFKHLYDDLSKNEKVFKVFVVESFSNISTLTNFKQTTVHGSYARWNGLYLSLAILVNPRGWVILYPEEHR